MSARPPLIAVLVFGHSTGGYVNYPRTPDAFCARRILGRLMPMSAWLSAEGRASEGRRIGDLRRIRCLDGHSELNAAGGKLVDMYGTMAEGPGAMVIFDADPIAAAAITGVGAATDGLHNIKLQRLFTRDELVAARQKRAQIQASFKPPGQ
jgi:hypothetical protein